MPTINYAEQYEAALLQEFAYALYFGALFATPNNGRYQWLNQETIQIPSIKTTGRVDGDMETIGTKKRNFQNSWTPLKVANHRTWSTLVHPRQIQLTNMVASIANITRVFNEEQKIPEMNAYCVSKLFSDYKEAGENPDTTVLTIENILTVFDSWMSAMDDDRVPRQGRILYVTPQTRTILENAKGIYRTIATDPANGAISRAIQSLDEVRIEPSVPADMMKTLYDFTEGWAVDSNAQQINMILVDPMAVITPIHYEFAQLDPPSAGSDGKYVYFEESFEDVFLLPKRSSAIKFNISGAKNTYTEVTSPSGNPSTQGYFEKNGTSYTLTTDTTVQSGKTYYTKS